MDSDRLEAFLAVAHSGGFSKAAAVLGKTQPAVSHHVARLEEELGQRLFLRQGRRSSLTRAGEILLEYAEQSAQALQAGRRRLDALAGLRAGELSLGASDTNAYYVLPPVLAAFRQRHPGIELRIHNRPSPATALSVLRGELDVAVVVEPLPSPQGHRGKPLAEQLSLEPLVCHEDVAIVPTDHPLADHKCIELANLAEHPMVLLDRGTSSRRLLEGQLEKLGLEPTVAMEMNSLALVKRLVELGFGVSVVPGFSVAQETREGRLRAIAIGGLPLRRLSLATPLAGPLTAAAQAFVALTREVLTGDRARGMGSNLTRPIAKR